MMKTMVASTVSELTILNAQTMIRELKDTQLIKELQFFSGGESQAPALIANAVEKYWAIQNTIFRVFHNNIWL